VAVLRLGDNDLGPETLRFGLEGALTLGRAVERREPEHDEAIF